MTWTLAVSTLITPERRIDHFLAANADRLGAFNEVLLVCQGGPEAIHFPPELLRPNIRPIYCERKGISASRNEAIANFTTDAVWFMDDDTILPENLSEIREAISRSPADLNTLRIQDTSSDRLYKVYPPERDLGSLDLLRVSSIEITCKRSFLEASGVTFPEWIGIGTPLPGGEENLFLRRAMRAGARIRHLPIVGSRHPIMDSEMRQIWNRPNRMRSMGIVARDCGLAGILLCIRWSLRGLHAGVPRPRVAELWSGFIEGPRKWRRA